MLILFLCTAYSERPRDWARWRLSILSGLVFENVFKSSFSDVVLNPVLNFGLEKDKRPTLKGLSEYA